MKAQSIEICGKTIWYVKIREGLVGLCDHERLSITEYVELMQELGTRGLRINHNKPYPRDFSGENPV